MKTLSPSVAKILASHVISNEQALECDWDQRGSESVRFVNATVTRAHATARVGTPAERDALIERLFALWDENIVLFTESQEGDSKCLATRAIRAVCVSLLCLGTDGQNESRFNRLFEQTISMIDQLIKNPGNMRAPYMFNIRKRQSSLLEMVGYANADQPLKPFSQNSQAEFPQISVFAASRVVAA